MRKILLFSTLSLLSMQAFAQQQIPEYCLDNEAVHSYLTTVQYDPNDYSYSRIMEFCDEYPWNWKNEGGYRKDQPLPVPIKLAAALDTVSTLYVSETEDFSDAQTKVMTIAKDVDSINVWNLIPGRIYNWKLEYPDENSQIVIAATGKFKTTGMLRQLKIDNVFNVRDLGGWEGLKGYPLKYGKIIRGSRLNVNSSKTKIITASGIKELRWAGMKAELDMRDASNSVNATEAFFSINGDCPIKNINSAYNSRIATFANGPQSIQGIKQLIAWFKQDKPVYLHCSVGADRTGTVAFLVGALCGMSEDALSKEFELTSFSGDWIENERDRGNSERLVRQRDYTGRLDPNDNNESYKFAKMIEKVKSFPGETMQEKVYYHLKTGVSGTYVPEADLKFLINYMLSPIELTSSKQVILDKGQTSQMNVAIVNHSAQNPNLEITYTSADPKTVTVSETGLITAVACTDQPVTVTAATNDGFSVSVAVTVNKIESITPANVEYKGETLNFKTPVTNKVKDGSFEYGYFYNWTCAKDTAMTEAGFDLTKYSQDADSVYLQSKMDGDDASEGSIRMEWTISKKKTYAFGFRVKNSTALSTTKNQNLKIMLTNDGKPDNNPDAIILSAPSYNGEWTDVQYVFTTTTQNRLRIVFTHLSQNGNNTCLDNFYLAELNVPSTSMINQVEADVKADDRIFNLAGQEVTNPGKGVYIRNGKKFIIK